MGSTSAANRRVIFDGRQEGIHEGSDRPWRRWKGFCESVGSGDDPFLDLLSIVERELVARAFFSLYRTSKWDKEGRPAGDRPRPLVAGTLRQATGDVAATFRSNFLRISPMHVEGSSHLFPSIRALLKASDNVDPPSRRQKAITPKLLRAMFTLAGAGLETTKDTTMSVVSELAIIAYFYAMRSCEFTKTPLPGRTKVIKLSGVTFRDRRNNVIEHSSPDLQKAARVTLTFEDQKNGTKQDRRSHEKTNDPVMCPVLRLASVVRRIYRMVLGSGESTTINAVGADKGETRWITSAPLRKTLRSVCTRGGGTPTFGFSASEIRTRSIRSGAAMALFLMNHPVSKIMILGRWSSDAFLVYIHPQVLEWTNNMSSDMISNESFFDATDSHKALTSDPRTRKKTTGNKAVRAGKLDVHFL